MFRTRLAALVAATAITMAACGGDDDGDTSSDEPVIVVEGGDTAGTTGGVTEGTASGDTAAAELSDEDVARQFAECMRDNGIEDFPDPTVSADGTVDFGVGGGGGGGGGDGGGDAPAFLEDADFESATESCGDLLEGASFLPDEGDLTEIEDSLLAAAECLREQGIDVDDPDLSGGLAGGGDGGGAPGGPFGDSFDPDDPEVAAAIEACDDVFTGLGPGQGGN